MTEENNINNRQSASDIIPECQSLQSQSPQDNNIKDTTSTKNDQNLSASAQNPKAKKVRKGQTDEEFSVQKQKFYSEGPTINTEDWLLDEDRLQSLDSTKKTDNAQLLHACEQAYFLKDYHRCLKIIEIAESVFHVAPEDLVKPETKAAKKKSKSHVTALMKIKQSCLKKLDS